MNERIKSILKGMDAGKAICILELWAERKDIQNLTWGGREWEGMNPTMAQELEAIAEYIKDLSNSTLDLKDMNKKLEERIKQKESRFNESKSA
jgi:hypothetical protein